MAQAKTCGLADWKDPILPGGRTAWPAQCDGQAVFGKSLRARFGLAPSESRLPVSLVTIRDLLDAGNVVMNRPAVEAGLAILEAGGDFADGIMAYEGHWLGGETFVSFDEQAVEPVAQQGQAAQLLS